jgi:phosphatidylserine decarboxylase
MINKNGYSIIVYNGLLLLVLIILTIIYDNLIFHILSGLFGVSLIFQFFFFRDPKRNTPIDNNIVVSPADGRIIKIAEVEENHYLHGKAILVSIFMSVFNVHVNRIPITGEIDYLDYKQGNFLPAFKEKSSELNEQMRIGINSQKGKIFLVQIAGIIARRIVCNLKIGDKVKIGERIGMIKYGSRLDVFLPISSTLNVQFNDKVKAGETIIGNISLFL